MTKTATLAKSKATSYDQPLGLIVRLNFHDSNANSHKFHDSLLIENTVYYRFGRIYTAGQEDQKVFETSEKAAAYYWNLLRGKIGKGYHVEAARVVLPTEGTHQRGRGILWETLLPVDGYGVESPELKGKSPRTAKEGAEVILTLTNPSANDDALFAAAAASASERFLLPLVLSHPACPDEAKVMNSLMNYGALFQSS